MSVTAPTKPVMDVAIPSKRPVLATSTKNAAAKSSAPTRSALLAVQSRSFRASAPTPKTPLSAARSDNNVQPVRQQRSAASALAQPQHHAPIGLITVAVFTVLVVSVLAVTVYVTIRTA